MKSAEARALPIPAPHLKGRRKRCGPPARGAGPAARRAGLAPARGAQAPCFSASDNASDFERRPSNSFALLCFAFQMYKAEAKAERDVARKARQELRAARKALRTYAPLTLFLGALLPRPSVP